jgi:arylsulfatase A-like enzyme
MVGLLFNRYGRYEGGVRVMLMAQHPSLASGMFGGMVTNLDIAPTILEAAGLLAAGSQALALDGVSWFNGATTVKVTSW